MGADAPLSPEALALLDDAPCGLAQTSTDGTFLRANRTFCNWVGHPAEELVGKRRLQDLLTMGGRIFHQTHWAPLLQMQGSVSEVKLDLLPREGEAIPVVLNAIRRQHGGVVIHDIAAFVARDRDKYERELLQSRKRLEVLVAEATRLQNEARDHALAAEQMIGIVSHDLRNPISGIQMGAALLGKGELSVSQQRVLARMHRATERARTLIADLLDFTQARLGGGITISRQVIQLHDVVAETVSDLALTYPGRSLTHARSGAGPCVGDANRLAQLLGNLISNAMTYGKPESPVTVHSSIEEREFSVAVHNDGVPIPIEIQAHIFQPMSRGENVRSASRSVGLGLFIVSEIAKAHGGGTIVKSSAELGTTFRATFPREG